VHINIFMIHCLTFKVYKEALPTLNYSTFQSVLYVQGETSNYWANMQIRYKCQKINIIMHKSSVMLLLYITMKISSFGKERSHKLLQANWHISLLFWLTMSYFVDTSQSQGRYSQDQILHRHKQARLNL
jgi:hypothetical protein